MSTRLALGAVAVATVAMLLTPGCSKENAVSADNNVGSCSSIPAGSCPEGFSPEVIGEGTQCSADAGADCKTVGSCQIRCVDPRGCIPQGSKCGFIPNGSTTEQQCCGVAEGTHGCINYGASSTGGDEITLCMPKCKTSADCPNGCCDATANQGAVAFCAPQNVCLSKSVPAACLECVKTTCKDQYDGCVADPVCKACLDGEQYIFSPECLANGKVKAAQQCAFRDCTDTCRMKN